MRHLTDEQRNMGHHVTLVFNTGGEQHPDDVAVIPQLKLPRIRPEVLRTALFVVAVIWRLAKVRKRFDVMHVHGGWSLVLFSVLVARIVRARSVVASAHGSLRAGRLKTGLVRLAFGNADMVYATGRADATDLSRMLGRPIEWQASGIQADFLEDPCPRDVHDHAKSVVVVANLLKVKNVDFVVEIARLMPEYHFEVLGDGPERKRLQAIIDSSECRNVRLLGYLPRAQVRSRLDAAAVFLCTSYSEGTPTAMIEGMARGLPVVSSNCADLSVLLDGGNAGTVVEGFDAHDYTACIRRVLSDRALYRQQSVAAVATASQFAWPAVATRITGWMYTAVSASENSRAKQP